MEFIFLQVLEELERENGKEIKRKILFGLVSRGAVVENEDGSVSIDEIYRSLLHRAKKDPMGHDFENVSEIETLEIGAVRRWIEGVGEIIVPPPSIFARLVRNYEKLYLQEL